MRIMLFYSITWKIKSPLTDYLAVCGSHSDDLTILRDSRIIKKMKWFLTTSGEKRDARRRVQGENQTFRMRQTKKQEQETKKRTSQDDSQEHRLNVGKLFRASPPIVVAGVKRDVQNITMVWCLLWCWEVTAWTPHTNPRQLFMLRLFDRQLWLLSIRRLLSSSEGPSFSVFFPCLLHPSV